jgi:hypothetical protein
MSFPVYFIPIPAQLGTHVPVPVYAFHRKIYGEWRHVFLIATLDGAEKSDTGPTPKLHFIAGEKPSITTGQEVRQTSNSLGNITPIFKSVAV